jgi:hypothetical protein
MEVSAGLRPRWAANQASGGQADVEAELAAAQVELLLVSSEQVHQQGAGVGPLKVSGDPPVARAVAAATAAVGEQDDPTAVRGSRQVAVEGHPADSDPHGLICHGRPLKLDRPAPPFRPLSAMRRRPTRFHVSVEHPATMPSTMTRS